MSDSTMVSEPKDAKCVIDRRVLNKKTIHDMDNIGLSIFAQVCGLNRGAFVLNPPDGNTWSCLTLPPDFAEMAGLDKKAAKRANITDTDSILTKLDDGNITSTQAVDLVDLLVQNVYQSTANADKAPYACNVAGLAELSCSRESNLHDGPIRSVTLAGVFVPAPWATGGKTLTIEEAQAFYTQDDFTDMKTLGLNTVQIPVPLSAFAADDDGSIIQVLDNYMAMTNSAGMKAILVLVDVDKDEDSFAVASAATYAASKTDILALTLPSKSTKVVSSARAMAPSLPLFLPANGGDLTELEAIDENIYAAMDMSHTLTVGDVASSTSVDDRMKLFYHEGVSCTSRSPIEYSQCCNGVPLFISRGFDLSIDDCVDRDSPNFQDYGQCDRFDETIESGWWERHRASFAERQLFAYERGLGWSFATWKLYGDDDDGPAEIDSPAKLLALKNVALAGLFPSLDDESPLAAELACLNPPEPDFQLGDDTLAPTPGPPPDCGDGWWNATTGKCDFWVPPPVPHCKHEGKALATAALAGSAATLVIGAIGMKLRKRCADGYRRLP